jgi:GNAT superfamily N-acetyltransferase
MRQEHRELGQSKIEAETINEKRKTKNEKRLNMIKIRKAVSADAQAITEFQQKMAWETEKLMLGDETITKGVDAVFDDPSKGQYYVAEDNGKVIASLLITHEWSDWRNRNVWWFQSVYVLPAYRRHGVFRSMYNFIVKEAEKNNVAGLRLYVETNNAVAQKTYESLGMKCQHYLMYEWLKE